MRVLDKHLRWRGDTLELGAIAGREHEIARESVEGRAKSKVCEV